MTRLVLPLALLFTSACNQELVYACTDDLRYAVDLTIVDEAGDLVPGTLVTYSVDGGETLSCDGMDGEHACGPELPGTYELTIEAPGFAIETVTQVVDADECHVITEVIEVTLLADVVSTSS